MTTVASSCFAVKIEQTSSGKESKPLQFKKPTIWYDAEENISEAIETSKDLSEILRTQQHFQKMDLLVPEGLDGEDLTAYLKNALFPERQWIGGDLERTAGYLRDNEQTHVITALRRLVRAAIPLEGRLPQIRNQTVHASETEDHYKNAFKKLEEKYQNPAPLDAFTFEEICLKLTELKPDECQDALSQFERLQRGGPTRKP